MIRLALLLLIVAPAALAQTVPPRLTLPKEVTLQDRETFSVAVGGKHQFCWSDPNPAGQITSLKVWRYRVEGGPRDLYLELYRAGWDADPLFPGSFCKQDNVIPKAGHWVYDAALCAGTVCSDTITAACAAGVPGCAGQVKDVKRGWWIYAFIPPVGGIGVN
jgi:hypothetical protein